MSSKNLAISYLWNKAIADQEKAKLSLELLTNHSVGIGDHSTDDFYENLDQALNMLVDARDRLELLEELYDAPLSYPELRDDKYV